MYAFTKLNAHSSRSHALVLLTVAKRRVIAGAAGPSPSADNVSMKANVGRLYMVDLAGSERLKKSMSTGAARLWRLSLQRHCDDCDRGQVRL
jgi:Kinesin motor domain